MRTYGSLSLSPDQTQWIIGRAEPHVSIRLKQLFPSIPKAAVPPYRLAHNIVTDTDLDWFMQRYPLDVSEADRASLASGCQSFLQRQAEMERILMPDYIPDGGAQLREGQQLRLYQWQAIEVLRRRHRLLLGDEGGLGKTYTAAGFMVAEPGALPAAVVCDAHMQRQWKEKIEAFTHLRVHLIKKGSPYELPLADVYVYRISQVAGWPDIFATGFFKSVTYDEPQSLRTGAGTAKGAACKVLSANTTYHLGLTATPIYNYGDEMWHIMQFIDDTALGQWPEFEREWCTAVGNGKYRIKDPKALGTYLREQYVMLRRLKSDVGQQLPKVSRIVEHIDYDEKTVSAVEELARALAIKATTASFVERGNAARELDIMMRQTTGVAKAKTVAAFARMMVEAGEAVVLWGWHRECFAKGTRVLMFDGSIKNVEDVMVGDVVMGPDSGPRSVKNLTRGSGNLYRVIPNKGEAFVCSENHILSLKCNEAGRQATITISIREHIAKSSRWRRRYQLYRSPAVDFGAAERVIEPWLVGYWLGDGASDLRDLRVSTADAEIESEIRAISTRNELGVSLWPSRGASGKSKCRHLCFTTGSAPGWRGRNSLLTAFQSLGLNRNKHIPDAYKRASVDDRRQLLAGLLDSDGHVYKGHSVGSACFTSASERLAYDTAFVARSLGLAAYVSSKVRTTRYSSAEARYYNVNISGNLHLLPMKIERKVAGCRTGHKDVLNVGFRIEPAGQGDFYGFEVDGDRLFLLADFTIVHNCYDIWNRELADLKPAMYTGSETAGKKEAAKARFLNGETDILIMSLRSGAGVDGLQHRCCTGIFGELDWSPGIHLQRRLSRREID